MANINGSLYDELISRNWAFINPELQSAIKKTRLFFAGCGLGSTIAELAARTGFTDFLLADGDIVEMSNLNRQAFSLDHLGVNKAVATKAIIKAINPRARVRIFKKYIKPKDVPTLMKGINFIVNTVDFSEAYANLTAEAQKKNSLAILPFNIGYGSVILVYDSRTPKITDMFQNKIIRSDVDFYSSLLESLRDYRLPLYLKKNLKSIFIDIQKKKFNPQIGIASNITAAITITAILKSLSGIELPRAPIPIYRDFFSHE